MIKSLQNWLLDPKIQTKPFATRKALCLLTMRQQPKARHKQNVKTPFLYQPIKSQDNHNTTH